jgi:hypothetical protein
LSLSVPDEGYSNILSLSVPDEGYSRNVWCTKFDIYVFVIRCWILLIIGRPFK